MSNKRSQQERESGFQQTTQQPLKRIKSTEQVPRQPRRQATRQARRQATRQATRQPRRQTTQPATQPATQPTTQPVKTFLQALVGNTTQNNTESIIISKTGDRIEVDFKNQFNFNNNETPIPINNFYSINTKSDTGYKITSKDQMIKEQKTLFRQPKG